MSSGCDLEVDTEQLRVVADLLQRAAGAVRAPAGPDAAEPGEHAGGGSAAGREALRAAITRADQAALASGRLAANGIGLAELLRGVAQQFDTAEALCRMGG